MEKKFVRANVAGLLFDLPGYFMNIPHSSCWHMFARCPRTDLQLAHLVVMSLPANPKLTQQLETGCMTRSLGRHCTLANSCLRCTLRSLALKARDEKTCLGPSPHAVGLRWWCVCGRERLRVAEEWDERAAALLHPNGSIDPTDSEEEGSDEARPSPTASAMAQQVVATEDADQQNGTSAAAMDVDAEGAQRESQAAAGRSEAVAAPLCNGVAAMDVGEGAAIAVTAADGSPHGGDPPAEAPGKGDLPDVQVAAGSSKHRGPQPATAPGRQLPPTRRLVSISGELCAFSCALASFQHSLCKDSRTPLTSTKPAYSSWNRHRT